MESEIPASVRLIELREENDRLKRAKALRESYGINFYRPHWKQHKFHICTATGRYGRTGNRFGKSQMGVGEDVAWARGERAWYKNNFDVKDGEGKVVYEHRGADYKKEHGVDHPYVTCGIPQRPVKILILCENWKKAKQVFTNRDGSPDMWGKLFKLLPKDALGHISRSTGGDIIQIEVKRPQGGASTITIDTVQSYKNAPQSAESADWDLIHVDEPCPEDMFKAHSRGLMDRNGSYMFTCTPLDEMWINDKFCPNPEQMVEDAHEGLFMGSKYIITGSIYDNPYRSPEGVAEFESGLTREERECRLHGHPLAMAGRVYKEFIYDMHVLADVPKGWKEHWLPPTNYTIRAAWDVHGARKPQAILLAATAPDGTVFIYDELFNEPLIGPNAVLLKRKLSPYFVADQIIDPRACIVNPVTGTADVLDALAEHDLYFDKGSKDMMAGISATKEKLNERHIVTGLPTIYFSPKLARTLFEFTHYVYNTDTNEPVDKDDDMMENLRRLLLCGLEYVEPPTDADWKVSRTPFAMKDDADLSFETPRNLHLS